MWSEESANPRRQTAEEAIVSKVSTRTHTPTHTSAHAFTRREEGEEDENEEKMSSTWHKFCERLSRNRNSKMQEQRARTRYAVS